MAIFSTLFAVVVVAYYILKKYNPIFTFLFSGMIILIFAFYYFGVPIPKAPAREALSFLDVVLDSFAFITATFKTQLAGVGLIIMSVAGFAAYMKHINASAKLAFLANKPLGKIKNKYLILSGTFVVGMALKIVISSYAGLLLLLLACIYPVLIALKIRPITAVCVLSLIALDYGPKDGNSINMADMVGQKDNVVGLFLDYQLWVVLAYVALIALLIPFYFAWVDKKDKVKGVLCDEVETPEIINPKCPTFYILFPWLPVVFLFSAYFLNIKLDVVTANFVSIALVFIVEFARHKDAKKLGEDMVVILKAMAEIFVSVVSIIIAAGVFAEGIKALGGVGILADAVSALGKEGEFASIAVLVSIVALSFLVYGFTIIMGSGIAAFNAFGRLAPDIATRLGIAPITLVLPIEIASCLGRAASPIAGGIIALAGFAKVSPMDIIKRTAPLLLIAMLVNISVSFYLAKANPPQNEAKIEKRI
ncbi:C4-dicarboxylate transporter DcuC [Campylobacter helveticus]|uniref:C4-dicarboxylate transporter DcuC n=1 Tax=Campylobacter helveticus TaxID=28898 RepID=UPI0009C38843|nr:C4-dicarboxylate transporter DcuC [Campylobacter helveticus]ARE79946.1 anaerobic C4-dicarboxylate transporter, DcuC family [Campylobacter helveticus]TXK55074.1 TRAP transporter large permease subunit [Campylobacter helveticus]SMC21528.1 C4-dicarboxylate transporter, DcuC family [Campylobacter helveticus]SUW82618.1 C4-dicarboxylate anaerobic carrier, putative [Campylobacter helveticus]